MNKHNLQLNDRILNINNYKYSLYAPNLKLQDKVLSYYNGVDWCIVPLNVLLTYPVMYDTYTDKDTGKTNDITIAVCPYTLASSVFEGKLKPSEYLLYNALVLTNDVDQLIPIVTGYISTNDDKENIQNTKRIKRWDVDIQIFRGAMIGNPDPKYLELTDSKKLVTILPESYYSDTQIMNKQNLSTELPFNIHPKTLIHLIQYKSSKDQSEKYSVILGHNANIKEATGYDLDKSGFNKYIEEINDKIREKSGFIIPMLWFVWSSYYPDAKIIYL